MKPPQPPQNLSGPVPLAVVPGGGYVGQQAVRVVEVPTPTRTEYRTGDQRHLAQHYGRDRTSAQLADELGRTPGAIRTHVCRNPHLRPDKT